MGHATHIFFYEVDSFSKACEMFDNERKEHGRRFGYEESLDSIAHAADPQRTGEVFKSRKEANKWLNDNLPRWETKAVMVEGVSLPKDLSPEKTAELKAKVARKIAKESKIVDKLTVKVDDVQKKIEELVKVLKGSLAIEIQKKSDSTIATKRVKHMICRTCMSHINATQLVRVTSWDKKTFYKTEECPICGEKNPFASKAVAKKLERLKAIREDLKTKLDSANFSLAARCKEEWDTIKARLGKKYTGWVIACDVHG